MTAKDSFSGLSQPHFSAIPWALLSHSASLCPAPEGLRLCSPHRPSHRRPPLAGPRCWMSPPAALPARRPGNTYAASAGENGRPWLSSSLNLNNNSEMIPTLQMGKLRPRTCQCIPELPFLGPTYLGVELGDGQVIFPAGSTLRGPKI
jgi:hypothetical protein